MGLGLTFRSLPRQAVRLAAFLVALFLIGLPSPSALNKRLTASPGSGSAPVEDTREDDTPGTASELRLATAVSSASPGASAHQPGRPGHPSRSTRFTLSSGPRPDPFGNGLGLRLRC
jgi:hypothetical protein